jgi:hypothetical protein
MMANGLSLLFLQTRLQLLHPYEKRRSHESHRYKIPFSYPAGWIRLTYRISSHSNVRLKNQHVRTLVQTNLIPLSNHAIIAKIANNGKDFLVSECRIQYVLDTFIFFGPNVLSVVCFRQKQFPIGKGTTAASLVLMINQNQNPKCRQTLTRCILGPILPSYQ